MDLLASLWPDNNWLNSAFELKPHNSMMDCTDKSAFKGFVNSSQKCLNRYISHKVLKFKL